MALASSRAAVPFLDLRPAHAGVQDAILEHIAALVEAGAFTNGPDVRSFEEDWAEYCGVSFAVGLGSGLDAIRLGLLAAGLEPGDEVVAPAMTFVATLEGITQAGGRPVLVDIGASDLTMDADAAEAAVTSRTRFLLPVHLYGQMCDLRRLSAVAARYGASVLEDAAQAHGALRDGTRAGASSTIGAFSFYPGKNLGAFGDAGALTTGDSAIAESVRALREHGQRRKYEHDLEGYTARLDTIQALVLRHKLPHLDRWTEQRRSAAALYNQALEGVGDLELAPVPEGSEPVWHLYVVRTENPVGLASHLAARGIACGRHYPTPVHLTRAYAHLGYAEGAFPQAEDLARRCLSLPLFPGIEEAQQLRVVDEIRHWFDD